MRIEDIESLNNHYTDAISTLAVDLKLAKEHNEQLAKFKSEKEKLTKFIMEVQTYWENLALVRTAVIKESNSFQTRRIEYLNDLITVALKEIFPTECVSAKITYDYSRKDTVKLELIGDDGYVSSPKVGEGQLMQYVISFAAVTGITRGLGFQNVFIDEAFGVAAVEKLSQLGSIIDNYVKQGMQIILVSQNPSLYSDIAHREIVLQKDPKTKITSVVDIVDY